MKKTSKKSWVRYLLLSLGGVFLFLLVVILGAFLWVRSESGLNEIRALIEKTGNAEIKTIAIGDLKGTVPESLSIHGLELYDTKGVWLRLDQLNIEWSPLSALSGQLIVDEIKGGHLEVLRNPEYPKLEEPPKDTSEEGGEIPALPLAVKIENLGLDAIHLGADLLGKEAHYSFASQLIAGIWGDATKLDFSLKGIQGTPGAVDAHVAFNPKSKYLSVDVNGHEPAGGFIVKQLSVPAHPEFVMILKGEGEIKDWKGALDVHAGNDLSLLGAFTVKSSDLSQGLDFKADFRLRPNALLEQEFSPLVGDGIRLSTALNLDSQSRLLSIEKTTLKMPAAELALDGRLDLKATAVDIDYRMSPGDPRLFNAWSSGASWQSIVLSGKALGGLDEAELKADLNVLAFDGFQVKTDAIHTKFNVKKNANQDWPAVAGKIEIVKPLGFDFNAEKVDLTLASNILGDKEQAQLRVKVLKPFSKAFQAKDVGLTVKMMPDRPFADPEANWQLKILGDVNQPRGEQPEIALAVGDKLSWDLIGTILPAEKKVLIVDSHFNTLLAQAQIHDTQVLEWGQDVSINAAIHVPKLSGLRQIAKVDLSGQSSLELKAHVRDFGKTVQAKLSGGLRQFRTNIPEADALIDGELSWQVRAKIDEDKTVRVDTAKLHSKGLDLTAGAILKPDQNLNAHWRLHLPDLNLLEPSLAIPIEGALAISGRAVGNSTSPFVKVNLSTDAIDVKGTRIRKTNIDVDAENLNRSPKGRIGLVSWVDGNKAEASTRFLLEKNDRLLIDALTLKALGVKVLGDLQVMLKKQTARGSITGQVENLDFIAQKTELPLNGNLNFSVKLDDTTDQKANLKLNARDFSLGGDAALKIKKVDLTADVSDVLVEPRLKARVDVIGLDNKDAFVKALGLDANGDLKSLSFKIKTLGQLKSLDKAFDLASFGNIEMDENKKALSLKQLNANFADVPIRLNKPMQVKMLADEIILRDLDLALDKGSVSADAHLGKGVFSGQAQMRRISLDLMRVVGQDFGVHGHINSDMKMSGTLKDPQANASIVISDLTLDTGDEDHLKPGSLNVDLKLIDKKASLNAKLKQPEVGNFFASGEIPVGLTQEPLGVDLPPATPLVAEAKGSIDLKSVMQVMPVDGHQIEGVINLDAKVQGTIEKPEIKGVVQMQKGNYENLAFGTHLSDMNLLIEADPKRIEIKRISAKTPQDGAIGVKGFVDLANMEDLVLGMKVKMKKAQLAATDMITAFASSDVSLDGPLSNADLSGNITFNKVEVYIPETMPANVVVLDVTEKGDGEKEGVGAVEQEKKAPAFKANLNMDIVFPNQVYVRGRGLTSELNGKLKVTGTSEKPNIDGSLAMRRGTLNLMNRHFVFKKGEVLLDGVPSKEPSLDFIANATASKDAEINILVSGPVSKPKIGLESKPEMPQDEILSRMLFGKPAGALTPAEAVELAASAATLAGVGAGPGVVDQVRSSLGLDTLKFNNDQGAGPGIEAGRYIADKVYVGVKQGISEGSSAATVKVEVTPNITVESDLGADSQSRMGVNMQWDY